jgi:hypothetical protein
LLVFEKFEHCLLNGPASGTGNAALLEIFLKLSLVGAKLIMGMDLIEIVLKIEDVFELEIPDQVAANLNTPGKVIDHVFSQLKSRQ